MYRLLLFVCLSLFCCFSLAAKYSFEPSNTYVVMVGVLNWEGPLGNFETKNRKDQELYDLFKSNGIPEDNMLLLLDKDATLENMTSTILKVLAKTDENSTFLFYYAGHGINEGSGIYFANYDIDLYHLIKTGFNIKELGKTINESFKGRTVILCADCCYSGGLIAVGETIAKNNKQALVLTSASAHIISTENWTFTQTLIDCFSGNPLADRNSDGVISITEMAQEVKDAMKYRENQECGFEIWNLEKDSIVQSTKKSSRKNISGDFKIGDYVFADYNNQNYSARVIGIEENNVVCEFYFYSDKKHQTIAIDKVTKIPLRDYTTEVEWEGSWYPAVIIKQKEGKYFIHYIGYEASWDEWVSEKRIRFKK